MTDAGKQAGEIERYLVAKVAEELMASPDAAGAQLPGDDGLLSQVTKAVLEQAMSVAMAEPTGYEKGDRAGRGSGILPIGPISTASVTNANTIQSKYRDDL